MENSSIYRALIVDDEAAIRQLTLRALATEGFQCHTAADGREAQQLLQDTTYDLVVTDLRMPHLNGHALIADLLLKRDRPVIIALTGVLEPSLVKDLIARGVDQIEFKPIDCTMFGAKARALVSRDRLHSVRHDKTSRAPGSTASRRGEGVCVADVMTRDVHTTTPVATVSDVTKQMSITGVRHLPVVNYKHEPIGIVTQRDLFRHVGRVLEAEKGEMRGQVGEFMSPTVESASPATPLAEAAEKMLAKKFGCLPVVEEDRKLVGILTRSDLLRHLIELQQAESRASQPE